MTFQMQKKFQSNFLQFFYVNSLEGEISYFLPTIYNSGSQPGVRVPPGVREKSRGVRQFSLV